MVAEPKLSVSPLTTNSPDIIIVSLVSGLQNFVNYFLANCCMHVITYPYMHIPVSVHAYTKCTCTFIYLIVLLSASIFLTCITGCYLSVVFTCVAPGRRHVVRTSRESA
jgi:hypothetical protein